MQAKRGPQAFVSRHPLVSLGALVLVIGFIFDAMLEISLVRTGLYIYSQAIPFGTLFAGTTFQFPLIWESLSVTFVMIPAAILVYRDDTGKSVAEKLAAKAKMFPTKPVLGTFLVMFAIINVSYFAYGGWFWVIKASGVATSVACPWPYPEAKVYDPQGYYEKAGAEGRSRSASGPPGSRGCPTAGPTSNRPRRGRARAHRRRALTVAPARTADATSSGRHHRRVPRSGVRLGRAPVPRGLARGRRDAAPDRGMPLLREATGAGSRRRQADRCAARPDGPASVDAAAKAIGEAVGATVRAGAQRRESPPPGWSRRPMWRCGRRMFATHVLGPVALTKALLPSMRAAGEGRIVLVSSAGGVRGQPGTAPYSAAKGALERWGESMAGEIAPFGLGVTILVAGTYDTEIITDAGHHRRP